jgi:transposase InsO family protein
MPPPQTGGPADWPRPVHIAVTEHPTAAWTVQQFRDAFPWDQLPRYVLRDRDHAFDHLKTIGTQEVLTAPGSPWQNTYVERFIGSVRRECLDHVIVLTRPAFVAMHPFPVLSRRRRLAA